MKPNKKYSAAVVGVAMFAALNAHAQAVESSGPKFKGLLQAWGIYDSGSSVSNNFAVRRAELGLSGAWVPQLKYGVMIDAAKAMPSAYAITSDLKILQDFGLTWVPAEGFEWTVGQFKILTNAESLESSGDLYFPERSAMARGFGDNRQMGTKMDFKKGMFRVQAALTNGGSANTDDTTAAKDLSARVDIKPIEQVAVGAFYWTADMDTYNSNRYGVNLKIHRLLGAETATLEFADGRGINGWAGQLAYALTDQWVPAVRYDFYSTATPTVVSGSAFSAAVSYLVSGHGAKVQLNYSLLTGMSGGNGKYAISSAMSGVTSHLVVLALQSKI